MAYSSETKSNPRTQAEKEGDSPQEARTHGERNPTLPWNSPPEQGAGYREKAQQGYSGRAKWGPGDTRGWSAKQGSRKVGMKMRENEVTSRLGSFGKLRGDLCERSLCQERGRGNNQLRMLSSPPREGKQEREKKRRQGPGALLSRK